MWYLNLPNFIGFLIEFSYVEGEISGFVGSGSFVRIARSGKNRASSSNW